MKKTLFPRLKKRLTTKTQNVLCSLEKSLHAIFFGLGALVFVFGLFVNKVEAVRLSPVRAEFQVDPGQSVSGELKVTNNEGSDLTLYTSAQVFQAQGETGTPLLVESSEGFPLWVSMEPAIFLKKDETKTLKYTITVPQNTLPGGNFGAIVLSRQSNSGGGNVVIGSKIATLVFLRVSGDIKEEGGIVKFKHERNTFGVLPVHFSYRFSNQGADRLYPQGTVTVRNLLGIRVKRFNANPVDGNVLPQSTRKFELSWNRANDRVSQEERAGLKELPEKLSFFKKVGYQAQHFALGVFFAHLSLDYGFGEPQHDSATKLFVVFPWEFMLCLAVVLVILYFISRPLISRYHASIITNYEEKRSKN